MKVFVCSGNDLCHIVNIQTQTQTHRQTTFWPAYINSSASWDE